MLRWCKRKITRSLFKFLNRTSLESRGKLKGVGKIWWDKETRMYKLEGEGRRVYPESVGRSSKDKDMVAGRDFILRLMQFTWCGWVEGSLCFFWRFPR